VRQLAHAFEAEHAPVPGFCRDAVADEDVDVVDAIERRCHGAEVAAASAAPAILGIHAPLASIGLLR
jgi:hypothetical protein